MQQSKAKNRLIAILLWALCLMMFMPMFFVFTNAFKSFKEVIMYPVALPKQLGLENFTEVWNKSNYGHVFLNTIYFAALSTVLVVMLSAMAGYRLCRMNNRLSQGLVMVFTIALMLPFPVVMIPIATVATKLGFTNNLTLISVLNAGFSCSTAIIMYMQTVRSVPKELEECARIDGCGSYGIFFRIVFPILKPMTGTLIVIYVIRCWNDLLLPLILITKKQLYTIPMSQLTFYNEFTNNRWNLLLASGLMAILPVVVLYMFSQRYIIQGMVDGALKG